MSTNRVSALAESLVCSVENTKWPVSDAWIAIRRSQVADFADEDDVGSCRRKARRPLAKSG